LIYKSIGASIGAVVERKQIAYGNSLGQCGDVLRVFLRPYYNEDGTYTIPDSLLDHLLVQVRIIDKQFRIFNNPGGDLMDENPYSDIAGYGILGTQLGSP